MDNTLGNLAQSVIQWGNPNEMAARALDQQKMAQQQAQFQQQKQMQMMQMAMSAKQQQLEAARFQSEQQQQGVENQLKIQGTLQRYETPSAYKGGVIGMLQSRMISPAQAQSYLEAMPDFQAKTNLELLEHNMTTTPPQGDSQQVDLPPAPFGMRGPSSIQMASAASPIGQVGGQNVYSAPPPPMTPEQKILMQNALLQQQNITSEIKSRDALDAERKANTDKKEIPKYLGRFIGPDGSVTDQLQDQTTGEIITKPVPGVKVNPPGKKSVSAPFQERTAKLEVASNQLQNLIDNIGKDPSLVDAHFWERGAWMTSAKHQNFQSSLALTKSSLLQAAQGNKGIQDAVNAAFVDIHNSPQEATQRLTAMKEQIDAILKARQGTQEAVSSGNKIGRFTITPGQ